MEGERSDRICGFGKLSGWTTFAQKRGDPWPKRGRLRSVFRAVRRELLDNPIEIHN